MKIENIRLVDHPILESQEIGFTGTDGKPLDIIVLAGINGTGKTTLLETIVEMHSNDSNRYEKCSAGLNLSNELPLPVDDGGRMV